MSFLRKLSAIKTPPSENSPSGGVAHAVSGGGVLPVGVFCGEDAVEPDTLPGIREETPWGVVRVIRERLPLASLYGTACLEHVRSVDGAYLASFSRDPALSCFSPDDLLFVDTETTGLAGGTGTIAFLIGLGRIESESLLIEQFLLETFGYEHAALHAVHERVQQSGAIASFNGKSFDLPLLRTRWVMHRVPHATDMPHLDLLHGSRRQLGRSVTSHRLQVLEREILGYTREGDIPGHEIPEAYFDFLRTGESERLHTIVKHNRDDIVAMVALLARLHRRFHDIEPVHCAEEFLALATRAYEQRNWERCLRDASKSLFSTFHGKTASEAALLGARAARQLKQYDKAQRVLEHALSAFEHYAMPDVHLALAKLYEHQLGSVKDALFHAEKSQSAESTASYQRRMARLRL